MRCLKIKTKEKHIELVNKKKTLSKFGIIYLHTHRVLVLPEEDIDYNDKWLDKLCTPKSNFLRLDYSSPDTDFNELGHFESMSEAFGLLPSGLISVWSRGWERCIVVVGADLNLTKLLIAKYSDYHYDGTDIGEYRYTFDFDKSIEENLSILDKKLIKERFNNKWTRI